VTDFFERTRRLRFGRPSKNGHFFGHDNKITIYYHFYRKQYTRVSVSTFEKVASGREHTNNAHDSIHKI
jgi:hypothetical protein